MRLRHFERLFAAARHAALLIAVLAIAPVARAHEDLLIALSPEGKVVTGTADFDHSEWIVGARSFEGELEEVLLGDDPAGIYFGDEPGFAAVLQASLDDSNPPPGTFLALPGNSAVSFDILAPIVNGNQANLFYWDGTGAVDFQPASGVTLTLTRSIFSAVADGSASSVPGFAIGTTTALGFLDAHLNLTLDDGLAGSYAPEGLYLLTLTLKVDGETDSDPIAITFGAGEVDEEAHEAAVEWVAANVVPEPSTGLLALAGCAAAAVWTWRRRK